MPFQVIYLVHVVPFEKRNWFDDTAVHLNVAWSGNTNEYELVYSVLSGMDCVMVKLGRPERGMVP